MDGCRALRRGRAAISRSRSFAWAGAVLAAALLSPHDPQLAAAAEVAVRTEAAAPAWIWSPTQPAGQVPADAVVYFRKTFETKAVAKARLEISCDDRYQVFLNAQEVGQGADWRAMQLYDVTSFLVDGWNVLAIKAENGKDGTAGLVARLVIEDRSGAAVTHLSDASWRTSAKEIENWWRVDFPDSQWLRARELGPFGATAPWGRAVQLDASAAARRFEVADPSFRVERVVDPEQTGSVIAMAFNEWGEILLSREGGPLLLAVDKNQDGTPDTVTTYCDKLTNCQGILPLNGEVFAIGEGPEGVALYRLSEPDAEGRPQQIKALLKFNGKMGEHGPHTLALGPDGLLYVLCGNHSSVLGVSADVGPLRHVYDAELFTPKYEDPSGHANGIRAPGGTIVRTDVEGSSIELFAGGLRNPYDIAFDTLGELFTFDSDMEWDLGLPWYRPTRVFHVPSGGDLGWRSGWSVWPEYYLDTLPGVVDVGRGSPTGLEFYEHRQFPDRYRHALFCADWAQGRIVAVMLVPTGGSYQARTEVFLQGRPLNVTDLAVGPDGALYFITGGRGTEGGVYRVRYTAASPPPALSGIAAAIRQPQPTSAFARQQIAAVQQELGDAWGTQLVSVATNPANRIEDRLRAIDLMQLYGPYPSTKGLVHWAGDKHPLLRRKAAYLMGLHVDEQTAARLVELLADKDAGVRRQACESLVRGGYRAAPEVLLPLLADPQRFVAYAARRALEAQPVAGWREAVLKAPEPRVFLVGATALLTVSPEKDTALAVAARAHQLLQSYLTDADFLDLLRVCELAVVQGGLTRDDVRGLSTSLAAEYPAGLWPMNRELVRLLAALDEPGALDRMLAELRGEAPQTEKLHVAFHLRFLDGGWKSAERLTVLQFYEDARGLEGGHSLQGYLENVARDFFATFDEGERRQVLAEGERWPGAALSVLARLPAEPGAEVLGELQQLDRRLSGATDPRAELLRTGIVAVLGRSGDPDAMRYLREQFEADPERRAELAMGLAQSPRGDNWPLLVRALPVVEGVAAQEVLAQLASASEKPEQPEPLRQVILLGLRLKESGAPLALKLLEHWTGQRPAAAGATWDTALAAWQNWFAAEYPHSPPPRLPAEQAGTKWTTDELVGYLRGEGAASGDPARGALVFEKAQCLRCHRYDGRGESIGPDLSSVAQRFQKREIVESVLHPSQVVSDQYASKIIVTTDGLTLTGLVGSAGADGIVVLQPDGKKVQLDQDRIETIAPSPKSAMPDGLFDRLTLDEIADLFAYLNQPSSTARRE